MENNNFINKHISGSDICVCCGRDIPEGTQYCAICGEILTKDTKTNVPKFCSEYSKK